MLGPHLVETGRHCFWASAWSFYAKAVTLKAETTRQLLLGGVGERVPLEVRETALPENAGDGEFDALVGVGDHRGSLNDHR